MEQAVVGQQGVDEAARPLQLGQLPHAMQMSAPLGVEELLRGATEHQRLITGERYEGRVGTIAHAIIDRPADRSDAELPWARHGARARLSWQADDIDGVTFLDRAFAPGTLVEVIPREVVDDYDFVAESVRVLSAPAADIKAALRRQLPLVATTIGSFGR